MSNSISLPKMAAPGETFSTVWYDERMAYAALVTKSARTSLGSTVSAMSNSAVRAMVIST
jgi:hypothetical protein